MSRDRWDLLRGELDRLAGRAEQGLVRDRRAARFGAALRAEAWRPAVAMGLCLVIQGTGRALGFRTVELGFVELTAIAVLALLLPLGWRLLRDARLRVARGRALGEWDRQLGLHDRLAAADEFLARPRRSGFEEAAVADADAHLGLARDAELRFAPHRTGARVLALPSAVALGLLLLTMWVSGGGAVAPPPDEDLEAALPPATEAEAAAPEGELPVREPERAPEGAQGQQRPPEEEQGSESHAADASQAEESKKTQGMIGSGRSSESESSSGAGSAQGAPSKQGQISKPGERKTGAPKKETEPKDPPRNDDELKKNEEQESGSTAGRGSSRGSNKNPAASDWASKDHVNTPDDEDLDQEDEVDDEDEEQEARGGMQPSLRDRKPPVSRDLSIGFGNQPSPDANGRGGPSQPKKSRGTASLVLGVPIPDRVKGQPNPGKTKITQERVQPRAEPAADIAAETRPARSTPTSALRREELEPWMRALVRDWFLRMRSEEKAET